MPVHALLERGTVMTEATLPRLLPHSSGAPWALMHESEARAKDHYWPVADILGSTSPFPPVRSNMPERCHLTPTTRKSSGSALSPPHLSPPGFSPHPKVQYKLHCLTLGAAERARIDTHFGLSARVRPVIQLKSKYHPTRAAGMCSCS